MNRPRPTDAVVSLVTLRETDRLLGDALALLGQQLEHARGGRRDKLRSMFSDIERVRHALAIASAGSGAG